MLMIFRVVQGFSYFRFIFYHFVLPLVTSQPRVPECKISFYISAICPYLTH